MLISRRRFSIPKPHELTEGEIVRAIAAQRGISETEALAIRSADRKSERERQRQLDERRARAGYPVFKPKYAPGDFTGKVRPA